MVTGLHRISLSLVSFRMECVYQPDDDNSTAFQEEERERESTESESDLAKSKCFLRPPRANHSSIGLLLCPLSLVFSALVITKHSYTCYTCCVCVCVCLI